MRRLLGGLGGLVVILILAGLVALFGPPPETLSGAARASDGDSFHLGSERVRLLGIDAPELDQTCGDDNWACGEAARKELTRLMGRGEVRCEGDGRDKYGRVLARCEVAGADLGRGMVEAGLALADVEYKAFEMQARLAKRGIWRGSFELPRDWRDRRGIMIEIGWMDMLRGWWAELTGATKLR